LDFGFSIEFWAFLYAFLAFYNMQERIHLGGLNPETPVGLGAGVGVGEALKV